MTQTAGIPQITSEQYMKNKKTKSVIALALAAAVSCGVLAGCDSLISTDSRKDYQQVIAEVDISQHADFQEGGKYAAYRDVITPAKVLKREMVSTFVANYASMANMYSYSMIFSSIAESLVNTQLYLQYSLVYLLENGAYESDDATTKTTYKAADYLAAVETAKKAAKETGKYSDETVELMGTTAGYAYFLSKEEVKETEYSIKSMFNAALDSQEKTLIEEDEDAHDHSGDASRTTPTGVDTEDEDYYAENYAIYIGSNAAAECGDYETVDGSTPTYRKRAYGSFLSNLRSYGLVEKGEDSSNPEYLGYYQLERKNVYQTAIMNKLADCFERAANDDLVENEYKEIKKKFDETYLAQRSNYENDNSAFESAMDKVSDTNFLLYAPNPEDPDGEHYSYGFVINILLPFSDKQSEELKDADGDFGDPNGNTFVKRANILKNLKAIDQRGAWFSGHKGYAFNTTKSNLDGAYKGTLGNDADRTWLFFEDGIKENTKYQRIKNYYGRYTYNGKVEEKEDDHYTATPNPITIDGFLAEMEGYLASAGFTAGAVDGGPDGGVARTDYYAKPYSDYYEMDDGKINYSKVDYSQFLYYTGMVEFDGGFDANKVFEVGSKENLAMGIINELSFAYNTDTAGLNSYLGYAVSPYNTNFVKEFEYAAQEAVRLGAGAYTVAPSTYGWHIMYCTFSWNTQTATESLYSFNVGEVDVKGSFSNLYFEAIKADTASTYASNARTRAITDYAECATIYEKRFEDLSSLSNGNE